MSESNTPAVPAPEVVPVAVPETVTILTPASAPLEMPAAEPVVEPVAAIPTESIAEPAEPVADPAADPAAPLHTDTESLLEKAGKPEEKPKIDENPAVEGEKPLETVEPVKYEPFTLPDGVPVDDAKVSAFQDLIGPHKLDQETAQKLVDLHTSTLKSFQDAVFAKQHSDFAETRQGWVRQILSDPVLGGSGHQTALMAAARMRDLLVPEADRAEFADFMRITGAGDHPAMMRLLHNAARLFDEPAAPPIAARPVPDRGGSGKQSRQNLLYDHDTSRRAAQR